MKTGLAALAVALTAFAGAANAEPITLKLAFFAPPMDPTFSKVIKPWIDAVNRDAKGVMKIDAFPGGILGRNPRLQIKMVQDGIADLAFTVPSYTPGRFPDNEVMELPGILREVKESSMAIRRLYDKGLLRGYDKFYVPMLVTTQPYSIHTNFPVKKISDLRGKKLRAGGPVAGAAMRALGAVPVGMPIPAVAENISKGILSGSAADWNVMYAFRIVDVAKYHYMARLGTVPLAVLFNKKVFDGLPEAAKAALRKNGGEKLSRTFGEVHLAVQGEKESLTKKMPGHSFVYPLAEALKKWDAIMRTVVADWVKKHPKGKVLLAALNKELAIIRAGG